MNGLLDCNVKILNAKLLLKIEKLIESTGVK